MLSGYLMTTVGASSDERLVEIKVDERRAERRLSGEVRDPERRQGERRRRPSLEQDLRARGYAAVVQVEAGPSSSRAVEAPPAPAMGVRENTSARSARVTARSVRHRG